eukprot:4939241-Prymnesium_polylepis.1
MVAEVVARCPPSLLAVGGDALEPLPLLARPHRLAVLVAPPADARIRALGHVGDCGAQRGPHDTHPRVVADPRLAEGAGQHRRADGRPRAVVELANRREGVLDACDHPARPELCVQVAFERTIAVSVVLEAPRDRGHNVHAGGWREVELAQPLAPSVPRRWAVAQQLLHEVEQLELEV